VVIEWPGQAAPLLRYMLKAASNFQAHVFECDLEGCVRHHFWLLGFFEAILAGQRWRKLGCRKALRCWEIYSGRHG
jgi:hypothetical protein